MIEACQLRATESIPAEDLQKFSATLSQLACNLRVMREEDNKTE